MNRARVVVLFSTIACLLAVHACSSKGDHVTDQVMTQMDFDPEKRAFLVYIDNRLYDVNSGNNIGTAQLKVYDESSDSLAVNQVIEATISVTPTELRGCGYKKSSCQDVKPSVVTIQSPQFVLSEDDDDQNFTLYELLTDTSLRRSQATLSLKFGKKKPVLFTEHTLQFFVDIFAGGFGLPPASDYARGRKSDLYQDLAGFYSERAFEMERDSREGDEFAYQLERFFKRFPRKK